MYLSGVNKNRKLVAFAERGERPHVVVYDLEERKRKTVLRFEQLPDFINLPKIDIEQWLMIIVNTGSCSHCKKIFLFYFIIYVILIITDFTITINILGVLNSLARK